MEFSGRCLCEAVHFQLKGTLNGFYFCHCTRCQKSSGSAHASNLFFHNANLVWEQGEEFCVNYTHQGTRFSKSFCSQCGCPLPRVIDGKNRVIMVPAGCLDGDQDFEPTAHIFTDSKKSWEEKLSHAIRFSGLPK
ncbi:Glutathione-dependent formaldehyde-activating enzyme [Legionella waltersii]|uniref:Glutathione-dependent formaldehyde-activating enzyme n=2 Tax=Legionella waltersii TaxID=66969 RepID=A0A0W1A0X5_9GAMM|nr:Glutathione-dependent formaldehyde-activating enzyme [Legionella waltersii]SNV08417.1 Uncharacterized conserved protein [Legionella waltersii]